MTRSSSPAIPLPADAPQGGVVYLNSRETMTDANMIVARMASDMANQVRLRGFWDLAHLEDDGWTQAQIDRHWRAAHDVFRARSAPIIPANYKPEPLLMAAAPLNTTTIGLEIAEATANILALAAFLVAVFLIAGGR